MSVTVSRLRSWQPAELESAADSLEAARRRLDSTVGDLSIAVRVAEDGWQGDAAEAAVRTLRTHVRTGTELVETVNMVRRTLHAASDALAAARGLLERALDLAADYHLLVTDAGTVRPSPLYAEPDREAQNVMTEVRAMVRQALDAADEADRDAAVAVRSVLVAPGGSAAEDRALIDAIALRAVPALGTDPRQVAAWWTTLTPAAQALLLARRPELIGMLDGVPAWARDRANRAVLRQTIDDLNARIEDLGERMTELENAQWTDASQDAWQRCYDDRTPLLERLDMLRAVQDQLIAGPDRHLLLLDTEMPGRAAIALGDVDTADHVAVLVPGFGSDVTTYMRTITDNAARVSEAAGEWLLRGATSGTVATVAWIGYEAPITVGEVAGYGDARRGAEQLTSALWGIDASRVTAGGDVHLTTAAHSYGSVVAGLASQAGTPMDDLVVFGSPGLGVDSAAQLDVGPDHLYVGAADDDPVSLLSRFGEDPAYTDYGGTRFQVDGGWHPSAPDVGTLPAKGHSEYYDPGTEGLANITSIVTGNPENATVTDVRRPFR